MIKRIPLHTQILVALLLGAVFGVIFHVDQNTINVQYLKGNLSIEESLDKWDKVVFLNGLDTLKSFGKNDQISIINFAKKHPKSKIIILSAGKVRTFDKVVTLEKPKTPATYIQPIGSIFIRLLSFLAIPLVIATLIVGAASLNDVKKLGSIGLKTLSIYIVTTVVAISIGLLVANLIAPGKMVDSEAKSRLMSEYESGSQAFSDSELGIDLVDFFVNIIPTNPLNAIAEGQMLQIVFFAVFFGITLTFINRKKAVPVIDFFEGVGEVMIKMVGFIMKLAPFGVFALIAATVADFGYSILSTLMWYMFAVTAALLIHTLVVYSILVRTLGRTSPISFFKGIRNAQVIGFSTSSSAATLPVTLDCVENNLGVNKQVSGFVLPLGATINMDGTALYQGVAAVFIAQVYGIELGLIGQLTIVITAVLASIGTAPVPGVGIIMLVLILQSVHIPPEGIALILGVDRILDMLRTITNVSGDASVAVAIAGMEPRTRKE